MCMCFGFFSVTYEFASHKVIKHLNCVHGSTLVMQVSRSHDDLESTTLSVAFNPYK